MDGSYPGRAIDLITSDGMRLEAEQWEPRGERRPGAAVVCHPHPLFGGTLHNHVVAALTRTLADAGLAVIRFNFRGVGRSGGEHDQGRAERHDVRAALAAAAERGGPVLVCGYSFGADVALTIDDESVAGWLAVSPPLQVFGPDRPAAADDQRPKRLVSGTDDQFRPADEVGLLIADWTNTDLTELPGADHVLATETNHLRSLAADTAAALFPIPD